MSLRILSSGPGMTLQDLGRSGWLTQGLSRGGAMDRAALAEGAALLGNSPNAPAVEMAAIGGTFEAEAPLMIALTGAPMRASVDGKPLIWNASHFVATGQRLTVGPAETGVCGYLHVGGGIVADAFLGAASAHLTAGIGRRLKAGDLLTPQKNQIHSAQVLMVPDRFSGGTVRILPSAQTEFFDPETRARLAKTVFQRDPRSNRMAVRLQQDGAGFAATGGLSVLSEITQPGDVQVTGDGAVVILMAEAQTTGGYPRIASIQPSDLPRAAQCPPGATLRFEWIGFEEGLAAERAAAEATLTPAPLVRDPRDMPDLLGYSLIDGVTAGDTGESG